MYIKFIAKLAIGIAVLFSFGADNAMALNCVGKMYDNAVGNCSSPSCPPDKPLKCSKTSSHKACVAGTTCPFTYPTPGW